MAHYVTVSFKSDGGDVFTITRSRESGPDKTPEQIQAALCRKESPDDALRQLCKTSIIRDEWIAGLSVDLSETERFDLVRSALGLSQGSEYAAKAKALVKAAEATHASRKAIYLEARNQLTIALAQLAEAKDAIARTGDVSAAMQTLVAATPGPEQELVTRLSSGRAALAANRARLGPIGEAIFHGREILALQRILNSPEFVERRIAAQERLVELKLLKDDAAHVAEEANKILEVEERGNGIAASLAAIIEHGERLGRHADHCPLCAAQRTDSEFLAGLLIARERMDALASGVAVARQKAARRFLSLKVGDGLNPQFVFSSGQRRAAGLAFLLSVHLSRAWTSWRTLLFDDPVQHIDDFRALHLIEVMSAFRMGNRQVVCAVEDEALADMLCRRLLSTSESIGRRYDFDIGSNGVTTIVRESEVPPMPVGVLRSRASIQAVG